MGSQKHENYDILNLIGYGLSKFDLDFVKAYGFTTKTKFYEYMVSIGIAKTTGTVKNRQDLFDGMVEGGKRKGWWQKGIAYKFRKDFIDAIFGNLNAIEFVEVVKLSISELFLTQNKNFAFLAMNEIEAKATPIIKTQFKKMQQTGLEAEYYFMNNYKLIEKFSNATIQDARLFGDGYDFQISTINHHYLAEIKGISTDKGRIRLTENEYKKAIEYNSDYAIIIVGNLLNKPKMLPIFNPIDKINFSKSIINKDQTFYSSTDTFSIV